MNELISQLSEKIKTEAKVWKIIAIIQVVIGAITIIANLIGGLFEQALYGVLILVIAAINFKNSKKDLEFAQEIVKNPVGIVKKYEPVTGLIITLLYNAFIGGVIGVVATVFSFMTRSFVMNNKQAFLDIENNFNSENN